MNAQPVTVGQVWRSVMGITLEVTGPSEDGRWFVRRLDRNVISSRPVPAGYLQRFYALKTKTKAAA